MKKILIGVLAVAVLFGGVAWSNISHAEGPHQENTPSISEILMMLKALETRVNELSGRTQIVYPQKKEKELEKKEKEEFEKSESRESKPTLYPMPVPPLGGFITLDELQGNPRVSCVLPSLEPRSNGNSVYLLQLVLKQEGSYPEGLITGFYGKLTQQAVRAFQGRNGLTVNGVVDQPTAAVLNEYVKKFYPNDCQNVVPVPTTDKFSGTLYSAGATTQMWGTHTLVVDDSGVSPVPMMYGQPMPFKVKPSIYKRYFVKAANDGVLADLKNAEGKKVILWGTLAYQNLEGGFWGIVAEKVYSQVIEPPLSSEIKVYSPYAGDTWKPGEAYAIRWTVPPALPTVNPQYLETVTITLQPPIPACVNTVPACMIAVRAPYVITTSTINDGFYEWKIPNDLGDLYQGKEQITVAVNGRNLSGTSGEFYIAKDSFSNKPPVISGISGPVALQVNDTGTWTISAYDSDGNNLAYNVNWGDYMPNAPYGAPEMKKIDQTATFTHAYSTAGSYKVTFTVVDEKGASAQSTITVTVLGNVILPVSTSTVSTCATTIKMVRRYALNTSEFGDLGLNISAHPEIARYRIRWFSGGWSDWYTPGVNDVDWKVNNNGTQRRVWTYFGDHEHEFEQCGTVPTPASAALIQVLQRQLDAMGAQARDLLER